MNVLAVLFRLLSLLSVAGLAAFLWFKFDTFKKQTNATLDDVVSDAYTILQVEKGRPMERCFCQKDGV